MKNIDDGKTTFIIGSSSQLDEIKEVAQNYMDNGYFVRYQQMYPGMSLREVADMSVNTIAKADLIIALQKPDGSFGEATSYELGIAKLLEKTILVKEYNDKDKVVYPRERPGEEDVKAIQSAIPYGFDVRR